VWSGYDRVVEGWSLAQGEAPLPDDLPILDLERLDPRPRLVTRVEPDERRRKLAFAGHGRDALLRFEQAVRAHPEILECYTLMGETDFLLRIVCRDIKAYEAFFLDHLSRFPGVQSVNSSIALAVIKETTALPLHLS